MTLAAESATPRRMGRPRLWRERMGVKFAYGTFARIAAVLREGENKMSFVRTLVMREVERREKQAEKRPPVAEVEHKPTKRGHK
jgi:hypothetical protein